jgi:hypothetical protein
MPGPPVTIGCNVMVTPGASGPPDTGMIVGIFQTLATAGGIALLDDQLRLGISVSPGHRAIG